MCLFHVKRDQAPFKHAFRPDSSNLGQRRTTLWDLEKELPAQPAHNSSSPIIKEVTYAKEAMQLPESPRPMTKALPMHVDSVTILQMTQVLYPQATTTQITEDVIIIEPDSVQAPPSSQPYKGNLPMRRQQISKHQDIPKHKS